MIRIIVLLPFLLPFWLPCFCYGQETTQPEDNINLPAFTIWAYDSNKQAIRCTVEKSANKTISYLPDTSLQKKKSAFQEVPNVEVILDDELISVARLNAMMDNGEFTIDDIESLSILKDASISPSMANRYSKTYIVITLKPRYESIVTDSGFDSFVAMQQSPESLSASYLKNKNLQYVREWNSRCRQPSTYNPSVYESTIDYDCRTDYGKDVEYMVYMYFLFMEKKHGILLSSL